MISPDELLPITGTKLRTLVNVERQKQAQRGGVKFKRLTAEEFKQRVIETFGSKENAAKYIGTGKNGRKDYYFSARDAFRVGMPYGQPLWDAVDRAVAEHEARKAKKALKLINKIARLTVALQTTEQALEVLEVVEKEIGYLTLLGDFSAVHGCFDFILKDFILAGETRATIKRFTPEQEQKIAAIMDDRGDEEETAGAQATSPRPTIH